MPVVNDYTALLSGNYWGGIEVTGTPVIVTYSFPTAAPAYDNSVDGFTSATPGTFQNFSDNEKTQARAALGEWAAASGLVFVEVAPGQGDINFQLVDFDTTTYNGAGGIGFYPFGDWNFATYPSFRSDLDASGDVFMNTRGVSNDAVNYGTLLHEIGHAIGLKHPTETVVDRAAQPDPVTHDQVLSSDDPTRTIMATVGDTSGAPQHLRTLDQQAAAAIYGPAGTGAVVTTNASGSNSTSIWSWNATTQVLTQTGRSTNDTIRGSSVTDIISGGSGNDQLFGLNGNDSLRGGAGNDFMDGGPGDDTMSGGIGDDTYVVDSAKDRVIEAADAGTDSVQATVSYTLPANVETLQVYGNGLTARGNDLANHIYGDGKLASLLYGMGGADYMVGGSANDRLDGGEGADSMYGKAGDDTYYVDNADDFVGEDAGQGNDKVYASVSYALPMGQEIEQLYARSGASALTLTGNEFANRITGSAGADRLSGGGAIDTLTGGAGADTFVLTNKSADRDILRDFAHASDTLEISASLFKGGLVANAPLASTQFETNTTGQASNGTTRFVYDTANGALYFDSDGFGAKARQEIAVLTGVPTLTASDFSIVP